MSRILEHRTEKGCSFRQAEVDLGDVAGHHHELPDPDDLLRLLHVADNLAKSVGLGTLSGEEAEFDADALKGLGLSRDRAEELCEDLQKEMVQEIRSVVANCL